MKMMKKIFVVAAIMIAPALMAQNKGECKMKKQLPELTQEQEAKIDDLRTAHMKIMMPMKNQMQVLRAELNVLRSAEKVDMDAINKKIEEIGALKIKMMKEKESHLQDVRKLLTEKQRLIFDQHHAKMKGMCCGGKGMGKGMHQGKKGANCPNQGKGMQGKCMKK